MISVVIPSYNSENTIHRCLDSLKRQSFRGDYEIVLVDSSEDQTPVIVRSKYPEIKFIHFSQKTDPGTARNKGVTEAKGNIIAFIDSDCIADPEWLIKISAAHERDEVSVIGGAVRNGNAEGDLVGLAGYIAEFREFTPGQPRRAVLHAPTCNISYKKRIFEKYGGFQKEYYPQEDLIFNYRLNSEGEKIIFDPAIQVYHHHRTKLGDFLTHQQRIGKITSKVLKEIPLEGSLIVKNPILAFFCVLFLPFVKFARTVHTFLKNDPEVISKRPHVLGFFALGLVYWVIGFSRGIFDKE